MINMNLDKLESTHLENIIAKEILDYKTKYYEKPSHIILSDYFYRCLLDTQIKRFGVEENNEIKYLYGIRIIKTRKEDIILVV